MNKKVAAILLMLSIVMGTCACDGKESRTTRSNRETTETDDTSETDDTDTSDTEGSSEDRITKESKDTEDTKETSGSDESTSETSYKGIKKDVKFEATFWSAYLPPELTHDEGTSSSSSRYSIDVFKQKEKNRDTDQGRLTVSVLPEEAKEYRVKLMKNGVDLHEMKNGKIPTRMIGGLPFISYSSKYDVYYVHRDEKSGLDIEIKVYGDVDGMDSILDSMRFSLPKGNQVDPPYSWEGKPFTPKESEAKIGNYTIKATPIIPEESFLPLSNYSNRVVVVGKTLYALSENMLNVYTIEGQSMKILHEYDLEKEYAELSRDKEGNVYVSSFIAPCQVFKNGKPVKTDAKNSNKTIIAPDGTWGLTYFISYDTIKKLTFDKDGNSILEPFEFSNKDENVGNVESVMISKDHIVLGTHKGVFVYDHAGELKLTLNYDAGNSIGVYSYEAVLETDKCFLAFDNTSQKLVLWDKKGNLIGETDQKELLDATRPWVSGITLLPDGSVYISLVSEREDKSCDEYMPYRLKISN